MMGCSAATLGLLAVDALFLAVLLATIRLPPVSIPSKTGCYANLCAALLY
jgi:hypothetical protein